MRLRMSQRVVSQRVAVGVVFVAATFISIMDVTIVNVALPTIGRDFDVPPTAVASISISFQVSLAVFISVAGWLGDRFGSKRVLLTAIVVFTLASALCGLATNLAQLVAFRVLQGVGGGMLAPVGMAMLFRTFPPAERVRASSILTVPMTFAPALGPVLGGLLVDNLSWRWVFYVNVPIGTAAVVFGLLFLEHDPQTTRRPFDLPGFLLAGIGLGLLMYGVSEGPLHGWGSGPIVATVTAGALVLATMIIVELRAKNPMVALRLLGDRLFRSASGVTVLSSISFLGTLYVVALYYQNGRGLSPLMAGLSTAPEAIGVMLGAQLASRVLYPRLGPRRHITIGLCAAGLSMGLFALLGPDTSLWWARLLMFTLGLGMAQIFVPNQAAAFATIPPPAMGGASTLYNAVRQLGGAVGVAVLTTVLVAVGATHHVDGHVVANLTAYRVTFLAAAAFALVGVAVALTIHDSDARSTIPIRRARRKLAAEGVSASLTAPSAE